MLSAASLDQSSRELAQYETARWIKKQEEMAIYVKHDELSPCIVPKQMGRKMRPEVFDAKLKLLNPSIFTMVSPKDPNKRVLYITKNGKPEYLCAFENIEMPEHSIVAVKEERYPDPNLPRDKEGNPIYDRKEASKDPENYGWVTQLVPWHEAFRGWRTVLIKLVKEGIATPSQVENIFGSSDNTTWAFGMGKRENKLTPW